MSSPRESELLALAAEIEACRKCSRLVVWREQAATQPRFGYRPEEYWARPVPGFGDPEARLVVVGLAPAAHGANRTGRMFTGDRSGEWLYRALWRAGFANRPESHGRDDGLQLEEAWVTAPVRCAPPANKPTLAERDRCLTYLGRELQLLDRAVVLVTLGQFSLNALSKLLAVRPRPRFAHLAEHRLQDGRYILCSYHPSQQNTFTGVLTEDMFDAVFVRARHLLAAQ